MDDGWWTMPYEWLMMGDVWLNMYGDGGSLIVHGGLWMVDDVWLVMDGEW